MNSTAVDGTERVERRRLGLFLLFAFGIAWLTAAALFLTGRLWNSRTVLSVGGVSLTLATVLLPTTYVFASAVANVATR